MTNGRHSFPSGSRLATNLALHSGARNPRANVRKRVKLCGNAGPTAGRRESRAKLCTAVQSVSLTWSLKHARPGMERPNTHQILSDLFHGIGAANSAQRAHLGGPLVQRLPLPTWRALVSGRDLYGRCSLNVYLFARLLACLLACFRFAQTKIVPLSRGRSHDDRGRPDSSAEFMPNPDCLWRLPIL